MADDAERGYEEHRRLRTPSHQSVDRYIRSRSPSRVKANSLNEKELELKRRRDTLRELELEVQLEREREKRCRQEHSSSRQRENSCRRDHSRQPGCDPSRQCGRSRSRLRGRSPGRVRSRSPASLQRRSGASRGRSQQKQREGETAHNIRSGTPSFSVDDVLNLMNKMKGSSAPQPLSSKSIDTKNILPNFDPSTKNQRMDIWLRKVNECASVYGWDSRTTIHFAMQKLQGLAKIWYEGLNTILYTWEEWQEKLLRAFPCDQNYGQILEEMLRRKTKFGEPIESYYYQKLALINQCDITGKRAVDCLIHGITDRTLRSSALALSCSQPDQLLQFLISNKEVSNSDRNFNKNKDWADNNSGPNQIKGNSDKPNQFRGHLFCFNCEQRGHVYTGCTKPIIKCLKCSKIGHTKEVCRSQLDPSSKNEPSKTLCITSSSPNSKFIKDVQVNNTVVKGFIDFGSEVTLVKETLVTSLGLSHDRLPSAMKGFGNDLVMSLGSLLLDVTVDGVHARVTCRVVSDDLLDNPMLIGQSYTEQPHIIVFKDARTLQFRDISTEISAIDPDMNDRQLHQVRVDVDVELYGPASMKARVDSNYEGNVLLNNNIVGGPEQKCVVSGGVYQIRGGRLDVPVFPCVLPCKFSRDFLIGRGEAVELVRRIMIQTPGISESDVSNCSDIRENEVRIGDSGTEGDKQRLLGILDKYKNCFARNLKDLGCTELTQMTIEINSQRPVVFRPYRLSHHEREKVQSMVDEMIDAGIVRESVSEYASPVILVRKPDGSFRMCIDYRMLNSITIKERYPMPIIDDEIARLSGQACFVTLDLASGYYQVPISEHSKHLTAFVTPDGLYEFNRMPFGLANAPAVFQRLINKVLGPIRFSKATAYMDDILIFGKNTTECLDRLEEVLELLKKAGLTLNMSKCCFLRSNIDYLGYEISALGVRPGQKKIQCVVNFPKPANLHGVRQFLGLASYFRKFIQNFAQIASPLTDLLKKGTSWQWGSRQEESFQVLKSKLIDRPTLAIYDRDSETELHTDASKEGVGGILLQRSKDDGNFRPVAYCSRRTSPEERYYHSYELETLAVVRALEKFRVYLLGKEFKIVSDCSALRSTFLKRDLIPRIARWWLLLQEFNCSIEYRPGVKMSHVDALSRNPEPEDISSPFHPTQVMAISEDDWLLTLQLGDSELERIKNILDNQLDTKELEYIRDNYAIRDNRLYRCLNGDKENLRFVVPKGARWQICRLNHDDIGHLGLEKTLERIRKSYWFPKLARFVKKYVSACLDCAYAKKISINNEGFLHPIEKVEIPFHTLHIDHLGPFVKSKRGYSYLLVIVDGFTKFIFIKPVRNTNTQNVIRVLDDIFYTFRVPDRLISDRGSCFTSNAFKRYCYDKGIKHILNAVASPKSNGQVERYNRTILNSLKAQNMRNDERDWDNQLGKIQWGLNNTVQKTTGRRPSEVMFGTLMNCEISPGLNEIIEEVREDVEVSEIRSQVKDRVDLEQEKQKERYDQNRRPARVYKKGDLVKITNVSLKNDGKSKKLLPSYIGPFRVIKVLGQDRYKIASIPGFSGNTSKRESTVAADRMLPWVHIAALQLGDDEDVSKLTFSDNDETDE